MKYRLVNQCSCISLMKYSDYLWKEISDTMYVVDFAGQLLSSLLSGLPKIHVHNSMIAIIL